MVKQVTLARVVKLDHQVPQARSVNEASLVWMDRQERTDQLDNADQTVQ